jgi:hypothetical protein
MNKIFLEKPPAGSSDSSSKHDGSIDDRDVKIVEPQVDSKSSSESNKKQKDAHAAVLKF